MDHKVVCEKWVELACACNGLEICNIFEGLLDRMGLESRLETRLFEETVGRERKVAGADFTRALSKSQDGMRSPFRRYCGGRDGSGGGVAMGCLLETFSHACLKRCEPSTVSFV